MRIQQMLENSTTAGSVATVAQPMMTQTRENINVPGLKPVQQLMKGKSKKKGPYANSINEGKVKQLTIDLTELTDEEFKKKYGKTKVEIRSDMKKVNEDDLAEQDLIVIPGQGRLRRTGFVKQDLDQGEHEGHTLKNSLHTIARAASDLDKRLSVQSEFPEWVSEKIGAAKGMMVTVMDYLISSQEMQHDTDSMAERNRPFRGVGGAFNRGDDERHDLDPTDWYIVKDGEMFVASIYPKHVQQAISQGFSRTRAEAKAQADSQGVAEDDSALQAFLSKGGTVQQLPYKKPRKADKTDYGSRHIGGSGDKMKASRTGTAARTQGNKVAGIGEAFDLDDLRKAAASSRSPEDNAALKRNPNFGKLMQKSVNKHNKAVVKTRQDIGSRIADIGAGGKEYNVKTDAAWDAAKKKVSEGSKQ